MKKRILMLAVLFAAMTNVFADNTLTVQTTTIPQGGSGAINIALDNDKAYTAFTMKLTLPEGVTYDSYTKSSRFTESHSVSATTSGQVISFGCLSTSNESLSGNSGTLLTVNVSADANLAVGTTLTAVLSNADFATTSGEETLADVNISITIGNPVETTVTLDETSTSVPTASGEAKDVIVKRTIKAGQWNTICLPFNMTEAQLKAAFGNDVQLAEFTEYEAEYDADDAVTGIDIKFSAVDLSEGLYADYPYLIKVSSNIDEFDVASVVVDPNEGACIAEYDNGKTGKNRKVLGSFIGTYHADTTVPANCLFLSENKFWYSSGNTVMKAFRGYFNLTEVLANVGAAGARVKLSVSNGKKDETTGIEAVKIVNDDNCYNLNGSKVEKAGKGVFIKNGKKIINK